VAYCTLEELSAHFTAAELTAIQEASWVSEFGHKSDALTLTVGWANHVDKLDKDRRLPWEDHSVWTEHDLEAALRIRDRLAQALSRLPAPVAERLSEVVSEADESFRDFTADDTGARMARIAHVELAGRGWWWFRVPVDGPVAIDLSHYDAAGNYVGPSESDESRLATPPVGHDDPSIPGPEAG